MNSPAASRHDLELSVDPEKSCFRPIISKYSHVNMAIAPKLPNVYSATMTHEDGRVERRYVREDRQRIETVSVDTRPLIIIRRNDLGLLWTIHPQDRIYFEVKTAVIDANNARFFPPLKIEWTELRRTRIDGILYRHFRGIAQTRHGRGEEHIYVDPGSGMFRREVTLVRGIRTQRDYSEINLSRPKDELFEFDRKGYERGRV